MTLGMRGLDFNRNMTRLVAELFCRLDEFRRYDARQVRISASFNRVRTRSGLLAYVVPLKFRNGVPVELRERHDKVYHWAMLPQVHDGVEILYYIYFMLPRFLNLSFREKLETVVHEIYHIHPSFNGDLRRFKGRSRMHGSLQEYDRVVRQLTDRFLAQPHDATTYEFLRGSAWHLRGRYGGIEALHLPEPRPKLIKVSSRSQGPEPGPP